MKTNIWISPDHQPLSPLLNNLFSWINRIQEKIEDTLDTLSDSPEELLMFMIYDWKFPRIKDTSPEKRSCAKDEWCIKVADLHAHTPYHMSNLIENFYNNEQVDYWSNDDDLSFYQLTGEYLWRKFRIIFHNSPARKTGKKISFQEFLVNNGDVRICWY